MNGIKPGRLVALNRAVFLLFLFFICNPVWSQDTDFLPAQEFANHRNQFLQQMPDSSIALFQAATAKNRSNDVNYEYRQNSNFYYLTGITDPGVALVLIKGGLSMNGEVAEEILFVPKTNPARAQWEASSVTSEQVKNNFGFEHVKTEDTFQESLKNILQGRKLLFYSFRNNFLYEPVSEQRFFIERLAKKQLKENYPTLKVKSPSKILSGLRLIKSQQEIEIMQKAIDITCEAQIEAIRSARAGMYEYQLEAVIEFVFKKNGAEYPAFPSIVASGPNSNILHYQQNRRKMKKGDLVVMDIGAEYHGYSADVTRTIPIGGKFSKQQREVYKIVLRAQKAVIAAIKPGILFRDLNKIARKVIVDAGYGKYIRHGVSHSLGLDTHDVGTAKTLKPGMVLTVEPGIYIPENTEIDQAYWNIGIRIEDDVLVREDGHEILSKRAPKEMKEIEMLMKEKSKFL